MPMGPITLYDVVGLDVAVHAGRTMLEAFPDRVVPADDPAALFDHGRLGQKVGRGFFDYGPAKGGKPPRGTESDEVAHLIDECRTRHQRKFTPEEITDRLFLPMLLEATRVLEDGLVRDARDVDLGADLRHRVSTVQRRALLLGRPARCRRKSSKNSSPTPPLGKRFEPTKLLTKVANSGWTLLRLNSATEATENTRKK